MEEERNRIPANFYVAAAQTAGIPQPKRGSNDEENPQLRSPTVIDPPLAGPENASLARQRGEVSEDQLSSELSGSLRIIYQETTTKGYAYTEIFLGVLEEPDGSTRTVAIKQLRSTSHFHRPTMVPSEVVSTAALHWKRANHPNVLQFIGYIVVNGTPYLVSPWCRYGDIARFIAQNFELKNSDKLKLLCDAARGLKYLHSFVPPIAHGAINPSNVLVKDNLEAALCDWGHSTVFALIWRNASATCGAPSKWDRIAGYMAKELLEEGGSPATASGDVYAFGGLILAAMSGKPPFWNRRNDASRIVAVCMGQVPLPEEHPLLSPNDTLWDLITECWSENPEARPSMELVLRQLERERDRRRIHENS